MKNRIISLKLAVLAVAVSLAVACSELPEVVKNYLNVSDSTISFIAKPTKNFTIEVESSAEWNYEIKGDWVSMVSLNETGLTISADANDGENMRSASILFTSGDIESRVSIYQSGKSASVNLQLNSLFADGAVSPSGEYVAGMMSYSDTQARPTSINTITGEVVKYTAMNNSFVITCVDDNGNIFVNTSAMIAGWRIDAESGLTESILVPDGFKSGCVNSCSADGRVWVGSACPQYGWEPMRWVDGVPELLERTKTNGTGKEEMWNGCAARGCSADGSIIYGNFMDYQEAIYWDAEGKMHVIAPELMTFDAAEYYIGGPQINADPYNISQNGKYLAFKNVTSSGSTIPCYLNIETGEYKTFPKYASKVIIAIGDDGTLFMTPFNSYGPTTVITPEGKEIDGMDWIEENYGIVIDDSRAIVHASPNGNLFGFKRFDNSYISWWLTLN